MSSAKLQYKLGHRKKSSAGNSGKRKRRGGGREYRPGQGMPGIAGHSNIVFVAGVSITRARGKPRTGLVKEKEYHLYSFFYLSPLQFIGGVGRKAVAD